MSASLVWMRSLGPSHSFWLWAPETKDSRAVRYAHVSMGAGRLFSGISSSDTRTPDRAPWRERALPLPQLLASLEAYLEMPIPELVWPEGRAGRPATVLGLCHLDTGAEWVELHSLWADEGSADTGIRVIRISP